MMNAATSYPGSGGHHGYMDHHGHMPHPTSQSQPQPYPHYQQPAHMMNPHASSYAHAHAYGYPPPHAMAPQHSVQPHYSSYPPQTHHMSLPAMGPTPAPAPPQVAEYTHQRQMDTTGQVSPPGMRPKVTATLWEDEGTLCFQVEHDGICVARREDNHMINGTKLLNVARMTRGRRDGILKSEKVRNVVKIGPMHLKGVWIPYERALEFANKEKITEQLYPLFVHNVGNLLHQPGTQSVTTQRRGESQSKNSQGHSQSTSQGQSHSSQTASLAQHPSSSNAASAGTPQQAQSVGSQGASGRPGLDRAHTYPTPPSNNTAVMGPSNATSSYEYTTQSAIDSKSLPTTPINTPPGSGLQSVHQYAPSTQQSYDGAKLAYSIPGAQQSPYGGVHVSQPYYSKSDMAPPNRAPKEDDGSDARDVYANERSYSYSTGVPPPNQLEQASPSDTKSSPRDASGRGTPRSMAAPSHWPSAYVASQQQRPPPQTLLSNNIAPYPSTDDRGDGGTGAANGYLPQPYTYTNGPTAKRGREPDDESDHYGISGHGDGLKRRKTYQDEIPSSHARPPMIHQR